MISAYCTGNFRGNYPLMPTDNGARCGPDARNSAVQVTIICAKL
jgi:hypothetical protein